MIESLNTGRDETLFFLHTRSSTLTLLVSKNGFVFLPYWGPRMNGADISYIIDCIPSASYMADTDGKKGFQLGVMPQVYPSFGNTDLRSPAFSFAYEDGSRITDLRCLDHRIFSGKNKLTALPSVLPDENVHTLELRLFDPLKQAAVILSLSVYEDYDAITQSVQAENQNTEQNIQIEKLCSASIDLLRDDFELLCLSGAWGRECQITRRKLAQGIQSFGSTGGASGHGHNPFAALVSPGTDETHGEVYAMSFVYSGNFLASAEVDMHQNTRFQMGLNPFDFTWRLEPGERFQATVVNLSEAVEMPKKRK